VVRGEDQRLLIVNHYSPGLSSQIVPKSRSASPSQPKQPCTIREPTSRRPPCCHFASSRSLDPLRVSLRASSLDLPAFVRLKMEGLHSVLRDFLEKSASGARGKASPQAGLERRARGWRRRGASGRECTSLHDADVTGTLLHSPLVRRFSVASPHDHRRRVGSLAWYYPTLCTTGADFLYSRLDSTSFSCAVSSDDPGKSQRLRPKFSLICAHLYLLPSTHQSFASHRLVPGTPSLMWHFLNLSHSGTLLRG
jgi:hypothetical protein